MKISHRPGRHILTAALLGLFGTAATAADPGKVRELVLASRVDAPLLGTFKDAVRARLKALSPEQRKCWLKLPADSFQAAAVDYLSRLLTDAEVAQGMAFFATPVGKRMARVYDGETSNPRPEGLTEAEDAQHDRFLATRPGKELLIPNNLLQSAETKEHFDALFASKWAECGGPPQPR